MTLDFLISTTEVKELLQVLKLYNMLIHSFRESPENNTEDFIKSIVESLFPKTTVKLAKVICSMSMNDIRNSNFKIIEK